MIYFNAIKSQNEQNSSENNYFQKDKCNQVEAGNGLFFFQSNLQSEDIKYLLCFKT